MSLKTIKAVFYAIATSIIGEAIVYAIGYIVLAFVFILIVSIFFIVIDGIFL